MIRYLLVSILLAVVPKTFAGILDGIFDCPTICQSAVDAIPTASQYDKASMFNINPQQVWNICWDRAKKGPTDDQMSHWQLKRSQCENASSNHAQEVQNVNLEPNKSPLPYGNVALRECYIKSMCLILGYQPKTHPGQQPTQTAEGVGAQAVPD